MSVARRFGLASGAGGIVASVVFGWMITFARWDFFTPQPFGEIFDAQARSLFDGHWDVPFSSVGIEGFLIDGRYHTYYGIFPTLLRMPVLAVTDRFDGRLTVASMVVALWVLLAATSVLHWRVRRVLRADAPVGAAELIGVGAFTALVGCGSIVVFLGSRGLIYHEVELWSLAWAMGAIAMLFGFAASPNRRDAVVLVVCSTAALNTRGSIGFGVVAAIGIVTVAQMWTRATPRAPALVRRWAPGPDDANRWHLGLLLAAVVVPVALYAGVNIARFDEPFALPLDKQVFTEIDAPRQATLEANGGSMFGAKFAPTAILQYSRPDALAFDDRFPWIDFPRERAKVIGDVVYDTTDRASSVTATMPGFLVLASIGVVVTLRTRTHGPGLRVLEPVIIGGVLGTAFVLTIAFIANRYLTDFFPPILAAATVGFQSLVVAVARWSPTRRRVAIGGVSALLLFGAWANFSLARVYQREPPDDYVRGEASGRVEPGVVDAGRDAAFGSSSARNW